MILEQPNETYALYRIPGLVLTPKKSLLAYYECRRKKGDWAPIDLKIMRSTDNGKTWHTTLLFPGQGNTLNNPVLIVDGNLLHMLFLRNYKEIFYCRSEDDGKTFTTPVEIPIPSDRFYNAVAIGPGHGIVHRGRLIVPIWFAHNEEDPKAHKPSFIQTLYSEDGGASWNLGEVISSLPDPSECALAVTGDDRVLISIRNETPCKLRALAISDTGTHNWQNLHFEPNLPDPCCMGSMTSYAGKVYHINCANQADRLDLTIKVSDDLFKTYTAFPVAEIGGYADIAVNDDAIYVLYESIRTSDWNGCLHFCAL